MSAGGLSYSGLTNYGRVTLPSAESWNTNMHILRDPPKGISTRKIDKVGETSSITQMIDDSGNRACEAIQVFARGINPSVSVSYGNYGNNGGQSQAGNLAGLSSGILAGQAKLPYRILDAGAFRPPVKRQEELLPLSRQPRVWTSAFSQPGFSDFSRKLRDCGTADHTKEVHNALLESEIRPTVTYNIQNPLQAPYETKYNIQPVIKNSVHSGVRALDITEQHVLEPVKEIYTDPLHANVHVNINDPTKYVNNSNFDSSIYIQDTNPHAVVSNASSNINTSIENSVDLMDLPIYDNIPVISHMAPHSSGDGSNYIHTDMQLSKNLPEYAMATNRNDRNVHHQQKSENVLNLDRNIPKGNFHTTIIERGQSDHGSRTAQLIPKIQPGGYAIPGTVPSQSRVKDVPVGYESEKARISRLVNESMQGRY